MKKINRKASAYFRLGTLVHKRAHVALPPTLSTSGRRARVKSAKRPLVERTNKGVYRWRIGNKRWRAVITFGEQNYTIGYFFTFEEAVAAYKIEHIRKYGTLPGCKYVEPLGAK